MSVILSVIALGFYAALLDKKVRQHPPVWYLAHLFVCPIITGIVLHPVIHYQYEIMDHSSCLTIVYLAEYGFHILGTNLVILNLEILFTKILPLPLWLTAESSRFLVMTLAGWLYSSIVLAHITVAFNLNDHYCFMHTPDKQRLRLVFRDLVPTVVVVILSIIIIATYCMRKSRRFDRPDVNGMREVRFDVFNDEPDWIRCVMFLNRILRRVASL